MDKEDRIVIMVGIIILVIAIIGILYHEKTYVVSEKVRKNEYIVSYVDRSDEIRQDGFVGKNGWNEIFTIEAEKNAVIHKVELFIEWKDNLDLHGIIFPWNWTDKMEASIEIPEMVFSRSISSYKSIEVFVEKEKPKDKKIVAGSREEVEKILNKEALNKINCSITLSIETKPLFFDRGNSFDIRIIYHYSVPKIKD